MTKVWVVTTGSYSDYHIARIFSTEALADAYATAISDCGRATSYREVDVVEWELDGEDADAIRAGRFWWLVWMHRNGDVLSVRCDGTERRAFNLPETELVKIVTVGQPPTRKLRTFVEGPTAEHAIKVANERRAQLIANGHWSEETT